MEMAQITREYSEAQAAGQAGAFFGEMNYIIRQATEYNRKRHLMNDLIAEFGDEEDFKAYDVYV